MSVVLWERTRSETLRQSRQCWSRAHAQSPSRATTRALFQRTMGCFRILFGLTLLLRTVFHLMVAGYAAQDLFNVHDSTSGTVKQFVLRATHLNDVVKEIEIPLVFFVLCGVALFIITCIYPWRDSHRSRLSAYVICHILYIGLEVYVVYVRTIVDLSILRDVYQLMTLPWLFPASLVLDVLTLITGCIFSSKASPTVTVASVLPTIAPLYRDRVNVNDDRAQLIYVTASH
ncbi:hypothetical protein ONE63_004562 [Megalurothrips usitatus]|uniref:Uncharacterized protein n=1 Tax=Megalurothrips usitatus TaxID=439358 RepID=A0AAV7X6I9_9NEOP|nr:hypothetical protein ONE63_004562 [Megalurothrips usitatus]